jgi:hypothetical protein
MSLADHMGTFKQLLDTCTGAEMDALCERYDGFYRFATLLERLAEGIAAGAVWARFGENAKLRTLDHSVFVHNHLQAVSPNQGFKRRLQKTIGAHPLIL